MRQEPHEAAYTPDFLAPPGDSTFLFGVEMRRAMERVRNIPETDIVAFGVESAFTFKRLLVDADDAPHFDVVCVWLGETYVHWPPSVVIPATRFVADDASAPEFLDTAPQYTSIMVVVRNKSGAPQRFRARVVGREKMLPVTCNTEDTP